MTTQSMSFKKPLWRQANLDFIRRQKALWNRSKLAYGYVELFGQTGAEMYNLLLPCLPHEKGKTQHFIGVDHDAGILMNYVLQNGAPNFRLILGDIYEVLPRLLSNQERKGGVKLGVVNLDTTNGIREIWWHEHREILRDAVQRGTKGCPGSFSLILNHALERGGDTGVSVEDRIKIHAKGLATTFASWKLTEKHVLEGFQPEALHKGARKRRRSKALENWRLRDLSLPT